MVATSTKHEKRIRLADVNKRLADWIPDGRAGKPLHISTWIRWAHRGVGGVKLRTERCGAALCTTETWVREFFAKLSDPDVASGAKRPEHEREESVDRANKALDAAGI